MIEKMNFFHFLYKNKKRQSAYGTVNNKTGTIKSSNLWALWLNLILEKNVEKGKCQPCMENFALHNT